MASASVGASDMQETLRRLMLQWESARQVWNDKVSREFEEQYVEPLDAQTRAAQSAMERLGQLITSARKAVR